jgi:hypothetical protein
MDEGGRGSELPLVRRVGLRFGSSLRFLLIFFIQVQVLSIKMTEMPLSLSVDDM